MIVLPVLLSTFYGYKMYDRIIKHLWNNFFIQYIMPLMLSIFIMLTVYFSSFWAIAMGLINSIMIGLPIYLFAKTKKNISLNSKKYFSGFGGRIFIMGFVIALVAGSINGNLILEIILMITIIIFGFRTHLNDRFYYGCYGMIHNKNL